MAELDKETQERIDEPVSEQAAEEVRLTPTQAAAHMRIRVPTRANRKLAALLERVNEDNQLKAWWHVSNVNAVKRLEINDHSWVHIQIVANIALLHCVGMAIHREGHEDWSLFLAEPKLRQLLDGLYEDPDLTVISSEVLGAITSHRDYGRPLTLEAGIVRVADALDMAKGRSRIPFEHGRVSIHSLSAAAIEAVAIKDGENTPVLIEITMNNSSGVYQVDELLKAKLRGSGLEPYVEVIAHIDTESEKSLIPLYRLEL
jgi:metal-dependent HD superfamily phosphatase/phosphodiesterase